MKTLPVLLSLAAGAAAQNTEGATDGSLRAATKRDPAVSTATDPRGERAALEKLSPRDRTLVRSVHERVRSKRTEANDATSPGSGRKLGEKREKHKKERKERRNQKAAVEAREDAGAAAEDRDLEEEERELKKTKSGKGDRGGWGGGYGARFDYDDDRPSWGGGYQDDYLYDRGNGSGWNGGWNGGGKSGKGAKGGKGYRGGGAWNGGKAGKGYYSGKAGGGYEDSYYYGKAGGKAGRAGEEWGSECPDYAHVRVTNLSYEQAFSEVFAMTSTSDVTWRRPVFEFGEQANPGLTTLAQDSEASDMVQRYSHVRGVQSIKVFTNFGVNEDQKYLEGGQHAEFRVDSRGYGHRLTLAMGMPFTNDGAVVLDSARIYDGAEYWIPAIDAGVEGNIQTCWSVPALQDDFPSNSECSEDDLSEDNDNSIPGENFVSLHRGVHDIDRDNIEDLLLFPECEDQGRNGRNSNSNSNDNGGTRGFVRYFKEANYDDFTLLCEPRATPRTGTLAPRFGTTATTATEAPGTRRLQSDFCDPRDDESFLDFIRSSPDYTDDDKFIAMALASDDFDDFCDNIDDFNSDVEDAFTSTEAHLFDWRNDIAHVTITCGWHGDDWHGDDYHDDWQGDMHHDDAYHDDWMGGMH